MGLFVYVLDVSSPPLAHSRTPTKPSPAKKARNTSTSSMASNKSLTPATKKVQQQSKPKTMVSCMTYRQIDVLLRRLEYESYAV